MGREARRETGREPGKAGAPTYAIAVVGASEPVGKSEVAANLAAAIALQGRGVTVVDCSSAERSVQQSRELIERLDERLQPEDVAILDGPDPSSTGGLMLAAAAEDVVVVVGPDAGAMRGAADVIRALATKHARRDLLLLVNRVTSFEDACDIYATLAQIASRTARCALHFVGWVPLGAPDYESIAKKLLNERRVGRLHGGIQLFVKRLVAEKWLRDGPERMVCERRDGLVRRMDPTRDLAMIPG